MIPLVDVKYYKKTVKDVKKETPNELTACCPLCGDTKYRNHLYNSKYDKGLVFCYNGGCLINDSPVTVLTFLQLAGGDVAGYKRETFGDKIKEIKNEKSLDDVLAAAKAKAKEREPPELEIPKLILDQFQKCRDNPDCLEYVKSRNLDPLDDWLFSTQKFFTFNDKSIFLERYLLIPIYNTAGKFKGFYSRSIDEKRFSTFLLPDTEKIWLLDPRNPPRYCFEGIFDALSSGLEKYGNIGAMIGADVSEEYRDELPKDTVFCFDNDTTGTQKAIKYAELGFKVFVWPDLDVKDTNELLKTTPREQIAKMIQNNIFQGIQAIARLKMKQI